MGREQHVNMDTEKKELFHELELKYQRGESQTELLIKDEDVRRLRLRILLLRDENTTLRDNIAENSDTNSRLSAQCDDMRAQLQAKIEAVRSQEIQLRKQEREFINLKDELQAMSNATQDSTKVLAEKLSLSRELAVIKPELDHLKSQLTNQQNFLAEKLELERQVNTLEVELANEKKATKRAMHNRESNDRVEDELRKKLRETEKQVTAEKAQRERLEDQLAQEKHTRELDLQEQDSTREAESELRKKLHDAQRELRGAKEENERLEEELQTEKRLAKKVQRSQKSQPNDGSAEDELQAHIEELETKLAKEKKQTEKIRSEAQDSLAETEARNTALEKKLEKMKTKLRETQDELKQCQASLKKAQQKSQQPTPSLTEEMLKRATGRQALKKRKAQEIDDGDMTQISIATPSAENRPRSRGQTKRKAIEHVNVGEKSLFSVTPFLNKTLDVNDEISKRDDDDDNEEADDTFAEHSHNTRVMEEVTTTTVPIAAMDRESTIESEPPATEPQEAEKPKAQAKTRGRPKKVLSDAPSAKKNAQPKNAFKKTAKAEHTLKKVMEEKENTQEAEDKTQPSVKSNFTAPQQDTSVSSANTSKDEGPLKKKKRRGLGTTKTLFDDEDTVEMAPPKTSKAHKRTHLTGVRNAFAGSTFSPLKRDRRGVAASFLA